MRNTRRSDNPVGARRVTAVAAVFAAACLLGVAAVGAAGGPWTVAAVDGVAMVFAEQTEGYAARRGYPVVEGATVLTGADGTTLLVRRDNSIMIYPNSEVTLPRTTSDRRLGVVQTSGEVLYRMQTPEAENFEVLTPYFAATVGNTVFNIAVAADRATVSVAKGMVRVEPVGGGPVNIVPAGGRVTVITGSADHVVVENIDPNDPSFWTTGGVGVEPTSGQSGTAGPPGSARGRSGSKGGGSQGGGSQGGGSQGGGSQGGGSQGGGSQGGGSNGNRR